MSERDDLPSHCWMWKQPKCKISIERRGHVIVRRTREALCEYSDPVSVDVYWCHHLQNTTVPLSCPSTLSVLVRGTSELTQFHLFNIPSWATDADISYNPDSDAPIKLWNYESDHRDQQIPFPGRELIGGVGNCPVSSVNPYFKYSVLNSRRLRPQAHSFETVP